MAIICSMDIIERLRKYRLEKRMTQQELADALGVTFSTVNRWFNGKRKPRELQEYQIKKLVDSKRTKR